MAAEWAAVFQLLDPRALDETAPAWILAAKSLIIKYWRPAVALGVAYLDGYGVPAMAIDSIPLTNDNSMNVVLSTLGPYYIKSATARGMSLSDSELISLSQTFGAATRIMQQPQRDLIAKSAVAAGGGWRRAGYGRCDFCKMLIEKGTIFRHAGHDFKAHDRCQCTPELVLGNQTSDDLLPVAGELSSAATAELP